MAATHTVRLILSRTLEVSELVDLKVRGFEGGHVHQQDNGTCRITVEIFADDYAEGVTRLRVALELVAPGIGIISTTPVYFL